MRTFLMLIAGLLLSLAWSSKAHADRYREEIECKSQNYGPNACWVDWRDAELVQQTSDSSCVRGRTWGFDRRGIWVDRGCGGIFVEAGRRGRGDGYGNGYGGGDWRPGRDWDTDIVFTCKSYNYGYQMCQVDVGRGGGVYISRQISDTRCVEGRNWGWNRGGVWVDGGCAAEFRVERRWR